MPLLPFGRPRSLAQSGQTLVSAMMSAAVLSVLLGAYMSMQNEQKKSFLWTETMMTRNMLLLQLQQTLVNSGALALTLADTNDAGNVALASCLLPSGNSCVQTTAPVGFFLLNAMGTKIAGAGVDAPLLYDFQGASCATASAQCLFQVFTSYVAVCPGGVSPCSNPSVSATYTIQQAPGIQPVGGTTLKTITSMSIPLNYGGGMVVETIVVSPRPVYNPLIANSYTCPKGLVSGCFAVTLAGTTVCESPVTISGKTCTIGGGCTASFPPDTNWEVMLNCSWVQ